MANSSIQHGFKVYTIVSRDERTRASFVPDKGGVGCSIIMPNGKKEREILFLHDNFWDRTPHFDLLGGWPFLFPICGRLERNGRIGNYLYAGNVYSMPIHGFSAYMPWQVINADADDTLVLGLSDNKDTLAMFPFAFKVELTYRIDNGKLICEQLYRNTGDKPLIYYAGFHPYFLTPDVNAGKEKVILNFSPIRCLLYNDKLTDILGEKKLFKLPAKITDPQINKQLIEVARDCVINLSYPDGFNLYMKAKGSKDVHMFRYVQIYTIANKPFICVEPWMGFPNALNTAVGSRWLLPGHSEKGILELSCLYDPDKYCGI